MTIFNFGQKIQTWEIFKCPKHLQYGKAMLVQSQKSQCEKELEPDDRSV